MAHHKSAIKRIRTSEKEKQYNRLYKSQMKNAVKSVLASDKKEDATEKVKKAYQILDKLTQKNIIHKNNAANQKSRLSRFANSLS